MEYYTLPKTSDRCHKIVCPKGTTLISYKQQYDSEQYISGTLIRLTGAFGGVCSCGKGQIWSHYDQACRWVTKSSIYATPITGCL